MPVYGNQASRKIPWEDVSPVDRLLLTRRQTYNKYVARKCALGRASGAVLSQEQAVQRLPGHLGPHVCGNLQGLH